MSVAVGVSVSCVVSDMGYIFLDGTFLGYCSYYDASLGSYRINNVFSQSLSPGTHMIEIAAMNGGTFWNPAGVMSAVVNSGGNVLAHTDLSWSIGPVRLQSTYGNREYNAGDKYDIIDFHICNQVMPRHLMAVPAEFRLTPYRVGPQQFK